MIKQILAKWFCLHKWKELYYTEEYNGLSKLPSERRVILTCEKCGKLTQVKL